MFICASSQNVKISEMITMLIYIDLIGFAAGIITMGSAVPQIIESVKTKDMREISLLYLCALATAAVLWMIYGFLITSLPVIITNSVSFIFGIILISLKLKYK